MCREKKISVSYARANVWSLRSLSLVFLTQELILSFSGGSGVDIQAFLVLDGQIKAILHFKMWRMRSE